MTTDASALRLAVSAGGRRDHRHRLAGLEQRLVGFLLDEAAGEKDGKIYMTQEQIARAIGSAREAVSRTLKGLVKGGCVELFRGGVRVVDRKELYKKI